MSRLRRDTSKLATASAPHQQTGNPQPLSVIPNRKKSARKGLVRLTLWPLVAATFFMVSGGTYGTEDIVHGAGYGRAILILLLTPLLWSLPTAFMIGELSSALPLRRRLLRLGAPRYGKFLGISGSLALAGRLDFRYGDLSHAICGLPHSHVPLVSGGKSGMVGCARRGDRLRLTEYRRRESSFAHVSVAVLRSCRRRSWRS